MNLPAATAQCKINKNVENKKNTPPLQLGDALKSHDKNRYAAGICCLLPTAVYTVLMLDRSCNVILLYSYSIRVGGSISALILF